MPILPLASRGSTRGITAHAGAGVPLTRELLGKLRHQPPDFFAAAASSNRAPAALAGSVQAK